MKRLLTLLCTLLALATGAKADEITSFKLSLIVDGEAFTHSG